MAGPIPPVLPTEDPLPFHRRMPGYAPTPLVDAPDLARLLGVGRVWVKDESCRLGLPSFKVLGASWATYGALRRHLGSFGTWEDLADLAALVAPALPLTLAAATDGNHGRAVAHMAALLGCAAHIAVPAGTAEARIAALAAEGARVTVVDGSYDDAVALIAAEAGERCMVISDTSWPGYEDVPREVIAGYSTICGEVDAALARLELPTPDLVAVQVGVGALAAAVAGHYRRPNLRQQPRLVGVEPTRAACVLASLQAGHPVAIPGPHDSIMAGLNCGTPSLVAWPIVSRAYDYFVAVDDERAREGMRALANAGVVAGETGAAGLAGLLELLAGPDSAPHRAALGITSATSVLLIVTEGATDPASYRAIVGTDAPTCQERRRCPICAHEQGARG